MIWAAIAYREVPGEPTSQTTKRSLRARWASEVLWGGRAAGAASERSSRMPCDLNFTAGERSG